MVVLAWRSGVDHFCRAAAQVAAGGTWDKDVGKLSHVKAVSDSLWSLQIWPLQTAPKTTRHQD
jgi:hypothetical protein